MLNRWTKVICLHYALVMSLTMVSDSLLNVLHQTSTYRVFNVEPIHGYGLFTDPNVDSNTYFSEYKGDIIASMDSDVDGLIKCIVKPHK